MATDIIARGMAARAAKAKPPEGCIVKKTEDTADGVNITFEYTLEDGTKEQKTVLLKNGTNGKDGVKGDDGFSPVVELNAGNTTEVYRLDITDKNGKFTTPNMIGKQGPRGVAGESSVSAITPRGLYDVAADPPYTVGDYMTYTDGNAYVCKADNPTNEPPTDGRSSDPYWQIIAFKGAKGDPASVNGVHANDDGDIELTALDIPRANKTETVEVSLEALKTALDLIERLPVVSDENNGMVLIVKNGRWALSPLAEERLGLAFIGNEDFTLKTYNTAKNWDGTLEYSTDTTTWNTWDGTEVSSVGNKLYLRGTNNTKITGNSPNYRFVFTGTDALKIACEGNIETLLDYKTVSAGGHPTMASRCYAQMFQGCTSLITTPELPATTLANRCYYGMFQGCTSLTSVPELPATTLADGCYMQMFQDCTSLITTPELPATTLASRCYAQMFQDCTSLITTPELPATILADACYAQMFGGCASLTAVPALPAINLADWCYMDMFNGCTKIKLSTTKTGEYQTPYRIPKSGTGTDGYDSLINMFTSTGGTFKGTPEINTTYYLSTSNKVA